MQYNVVAKKLTRRLAALGGRAVIEQGLGDDQHPHGYEAALDPWLARLWAALRTEHPLPPGVIEACTRLFSCTLTHCLHSYLACTIRLLWTLTMDSLT